MIRREVLEKVLVEKCAYRFRETLVLWSGQGVMLALAVAAAIGKEEMGGHY